MPQPTIPHDPDAEQIILAHCLLAESPEPLADLGPQHFYSTSNAKICQTILALAESKQPINFLEIYRHTQANNNGIPADYISGLTDGIPSVKDLEPYRIRLREKLQDRSLIWDTNALAQAAAGGASSIEIFERAKVLADKAAPEKKKYKQVYPNCPEEAWHDVAKLYRQAVGESTEANDNYHLAAFLTAVACLLGRSIFVRKGRVTYPNLYTVLIGKSGARKGTALLMALDFLTAIDSNICVPEDFDSRQGFISDLAAHQREAREEGYRGEHREFLFLEEFGALIENMRRKGTSDIGPELCRIYDCPARRANRSKAGQLAKDEVLLPTLSIAGASSPEYFENFSHRDIAGGLGNRYCWVPGDPKARKDDPPDPDANILNGLKSFLKERIDFYRARGETRLYLSPEAAKRFKQYYEHEFNPPSNDEIISVLSERDPQAALKVAMIYAALDGAEKYIELKHLEPGIAYVNFLYESRFMIFSGHGVGPSTKAQEFLLELIKTRKRISYAEALPLMRRQGIYGQADFFRRLVSALEDGGVISVNSVGGNRPRRYLVWEGQ